MTFFSLLSTAFSSIFYGVVVTAVIMAILYAVLKAISKSIVESPVFLITGIVMSILLIVQSSLMIGAIQAKDAADSAEIYVSQFLENYNGTVGAQDSQKVLDTIINEYPIIGSFFDVADFSGHDVSDLASSIHTTMIDYLNSYIWHRVWWILGIIVVACVIVMLFDKPGTTQARRAASNRHDGHRARSGNHQRINRRRK